MLRANYQTKIWYNFSAAPVDPQQHGYTFNAQYLRPVCYTKVAFPDNLRGLLEDGKSDVDDCSDSDSDSCESTDGDDDDEI